MNTKLKPIIQKVKLYTCIIFIYFKTKVFIIKKGVLHHLFLLLLQAGDIEENPGPPSKFAPVGSSSSTTKPKCKICKAYKPVQTLFCTRCGVAYHKKCINLTTKTYKDLGE